MIALSILLLLAAPEGENLHRKGVDLYRQHKYADAITCLEQSVKTEKHDTAEFRESSLLLGQSYFMLSQAPKAIPWLERLPQLNEANYMLGYAYLQSGQRSASVAAFARLFNLPPDSAAAHLLAGQMMLKKDYTEEAGTEVTKALELDATLPEAHFLLGEIAAFRGKLDEALENFQTELAHNPNFSMAWYRLGDIYARQQQWTVAIPDLQRAVWLNPEFSGPFILLGRCYYKTGDLPNAEGILRRAVAIDPQNASANYLLGQTLIAEGKKEEGRALLEKVGTVH